MKEEVVYFINKKMKTMAQFKEKIIISIVGLTNVGKSTLFNLISGQKNKAIVDSKAGTTADNVSTLMEIHSLGIVKLIDTAGVDEIGLLGDKKREKTKQAIQISDLVLFVIRDSNFSLNNFEKELLDYINSQNKQILFINNSNFEEGINIKDGCNILSIDANNFDNQLKITNFIVDNIKIKKEESDLLLNINVKNSYVLLVIPLDEESPQLRLLRPQSMVIERLLNSFGIPALYRPDLKNFDFNDFSNVINNLKNSKNGLSLIITDSQAVGKILDYIPSDIKFTTFSIIMANFMSNGAVKNMVQNLSVIEKLNNHDSVLIVEACKHDRKCDDIATVQIPSLLKKYTTKDLNISYNFGNVFPSIEEIKSKNYKLVIMCGGCMIDKQDYQNRLKMFCELQIPVVNYGLFSMYMKNKKMMTANNFIY